MRHSRDDSDRAQVEPDSETSRTARASHPIQSPHRDPAAPPDDSTDRLEATAAAQEETRRTLQSNAAALEDAASDRANRDATLGEVRQAAQQVADGVDALDRGLKETMKAADWEPPKI